MAAKMCWHLITGNSLWKEVIVAKYIAPRSTLDWIRDRIWATSGSSIICKVITKVAHIIQRGISWQIGSGESIRIGTDSWSGSGEYHLLPDPLLEHLAHRGITFLAQIADPIHTT